MSRTRDNWNRQQDQAIGWSKSIVIEGHHVYVEFDRDKTFRSRPGSADHRAFCSCGWVASKHDYEQASWARAGRHLRSIQRQQEAHDAQR